MSITVEIPDMDGNVISLKVVRDSIRARTIEKKCTHFRTVVDTTLTTLECEDCKEKLNPVQWLANIAEMYQGIAWERRKFQEAKVHYEAKRKCRCEHCGKITAVKPATAAQVREFKKGIQQQEGVKKL